MASDRPSPTSALRELVALREKATVGPWHVDDDWFVVSVPHEIDDESGMETFDPAIAIAARGHNYPDAAFIAAAGSFDYAGLLAEVERQTEALRQALDRIETAFDAMHPGDYTEDELHGLAQGLWFGSEELRAALPPQEQRGVEGA